MSPKSRFATATLVISMLLTGCAATQPLSCKTGEQRMVSDVLYFGMARANGVVTAEEWSQFQQTAITARFPAGLTSWQASGQWQSADGAIVREPSFVVQLIHADSEHNEAAVRAIVSEYKSRFEQEAVLRVKAQACTSF